VVTIESLEKQIEEKEAQLKKFIEEVNGRVSYANGEIGALKKLRDDLKAETNAPAPTA
jgi:peptidoglycan hydrolase CwlO-like protein